MKNYIQQVMFRQLRLLGVIGCLMLPVLELAAQEGRTIKGMVTDINNGPLPGVSIHEKGTSNGTITGGNGRYAIKVSGNSDTLIFTFVGYLTQKAIISKSNTIDIVLQAAVKGLNDVVVVGYGTKRKGDITGAVASVTTKEIRTQTVPNLADALAGKLPGLRVLQRTGEPGSYSSIFDIRGLGGALVVVDGVPRENFQKIDPNEIESVSILKDAAAAVYGVRAANGVILVTTKKGRSGATEISFSSTIGSQSITSFPKTTNAAQYAEMYNEAYFNSGATTPVFSKEQIEKYRLGTDPAYPNTSFWNELMRPNQPQQNYNLSATGGTDKVRYFINGAYFNQGGLYKNNDLNYKRYNLRSNISAQITDRIEVEVLLAGIQDEKRMPGNGNFGTGQLLPILLDNPTYPIFANNNPKYLASLAPGLPTGITYGASNSRFAGYTTWTNRQLNASVAINYKVPFITGLKARGFFAYDPAYSYQKGFTKQFSTYLYNKENDSYNVDWTSGPTTLSETFSQTAKPLMQFSLVYENTFKEKHQVGGLLLFERSKYNTNNLTGSRQFLLKEVDQLYAGLNDLNKNATGGADQNANMGYVGRVNYKYSDKYLAEFSFRYDGSSKFAANKRWGFFPAVSAGWRLSQENFIKENVSFINDLKLRASWGKLGDDAASQYQFVTGYNYPGDSYSLGNTGLVPGLGFRGLANPNITWFVTTTKNLGLDGNLWNSLLTFELDVFQRNRDGLLAYRNLTLPGTFGAGLPQENLNSDRSRGFEIALGSTHKLSNGLVYNIRSNVSYTRTKWEYVESATPGNPYLNWRTNQQNRNSGIWWGYHSLGQFQSQEEINTSPIQDGQGNKTLLPGDIKYQDYNGDGIIDDNDVRVIGRGGSWANNVPMVNYGLSIGLQWKGIELNVLLQGGAGFNMAFTNMFQNPLIIAKNSLDIFYDRWHRADPFDPKSAWVPGKYPSSRIGGAPNNQFMSDYWLHDGTYVRLKSVEIAYNLPAALLTRVGIKNLRVFANGFNLATWYKDKSLKWIDPENTGDLNWGFNYPITKNVNAGLTVTF